MFARALSGRLVAPAPWRRAAAGWAILALLSLGAAATARPATAGATFVDTGLGDVKPEQKVVIAHPQPVQLLFQFRTKGAPNLPGTRQVKPDVVEAVKASGLFSDVVEEPTANGAVLNVVIDNVIVPDELRAAEAKGFATGATFFVAGNTIREHYNCSIDYIGGPTAPKITRTAQHALLIQMGLINSPPTNAVKVEGGTKAAVSIMVRQIVSNPLNALASDPGFAPADTVPMPSLPSAQPTPGAPSPVEPSTPAPNEPTHS